MSIFICPNCAKPLKKKLNSFICTNNHCFDISKEGYINLLPINGKKTKNPGDNNKMIMARRSFLETGLYNPLAKEIVQIINDLLNNKKENNIFDLGCGEGYYSGIISESIPTNIHLSALDISKVAIKYGAKRHKKITFAVASAFNIPIREHSIDLLYRIFAPSDEMELKRVIKKDGYLVTVTPSTNHLIELREVIYDKVLNLSTKDDENDSFIRVSSKKLKYVMNIESLETIKNLLDMTPFGWKINNESYANLLSKGKWSITCDFQINIYKKSS